MSLQAMSDAVVGGPGVLHVYHPLGHPGPGQDLAFLDAAARNGAGVLEVGFPFSDPSADGPLLQEATRLALDRGFTTASGLDALAELRRRHPHVGLVAMAYANPLHALGWERAARRLADAGADAVLVPDMPLREAGRVAPTFQRHGVAWVPLAASTVPDATLRAMGAGQPPFVYVASLGVTGQQGPRADAGQAVRRLRAAAPGTPVAVGFGVRTPEDAAALRNAGAHGVVVGSALVQVAAAGDVEGYARLVRDLAQAVREPVPRPSPPCARTGP